jgi:hypothetical protein
MDLLVHEVLEKVEKAKTKPAKIKVLLENESWALKDVIRGSMDSKINGYCQQVDLLTRQINQSRPN